MCIKICYSKIQRDANKQTINVTAPNQYIDGSSPNIELYYTRLPAGYSALDIQQCLLEQDFDFIADAVLNFVLVLIDRRGDNEKILVVRDRFASQNVWVHENDEALLIATNLKDICQKAGSIKVGGAEELLSTRIISSNSLYENVTYLPFNHALNFEGKTTFFDVSGDQLTIQQNNQRFDDNELVNRVWKNIDETYEQVGTDRSVAVLLSGGVDSFILAATASKKFNSVVAYTPDWSDGANPELPRARRFAKHLGIKHEVIKVDSKDFNQAFNEIMTEQPISIRNYSSLVLHSIFNSIKEDYILYGEYADTLFGNGAIKNAILDLNYKAILDFVPPIVMPKKLSQFKSKLTGDDLKHLVQIGSISRTFLDSVLENSKFPFETRHSESGKSQKKQRCQRENSMQYIISIDCAQHMLEIETSALLHDKIIVTPFFNKGMLEISNSLSTTQMFGKSGLSPLKNFKRDNSVELKPILKKLACEFIEPDAIYLKKLGFPTPFGLWVSDFEQSSEWQNRNQDLSSCQNAEQKWSYINLHYLSKIIQ